MSNYVYVFIVFVLLTAIAAIGFKSTQKHTTPTTQDLFTPNEATVGIAFTGRIGGGKTTTLLRVVEELARADERVNFAFACVKPGDADTYQNLLLRAGRKPLRITADGMFRISPFIHTMSKKGGSSRELALLHEDLNEVLTRSDSSRTETFWKGITNETSQGAFELAYLVKGTQATYGDAYNIIMSAPENLEVAASDQFREESACGQFLDQAFTIDPTKAKPIVDHFCQKLTTCGNRAKGAAVQGATNPLLPFIAGPISKVVHGVPTHTPEQLINQDTIWDFDTHTYGRNGLALQLILSWLCQDAVLSRRGNFNYFCLVRDEYPHLAFARRDIAAQSTGRSQKYIGLSCWQSQPVLESLLGGTIESQTEAKALWGLHVNKVMCSQNCSITNEMQADMIGHERKMFYGGGTPNHRQELEWWDVLGVGDRPQFSFNQQWQHRIPPAAWHDLSSGGPRGNYVVEAIIYKESGHYFKHSFYQEQQS